MLLLHGIQDGLYTSNQGGKYNIKTNLAKAPIRMFPHFDKAIARNAGPSVWGLKESLALIKELFHQRNWWTEWKVELSQSLLVYTILSIWWEEINSVFHPIPNPPQNIGVCSQNHLHHPPPYGSWSSMVNLGSILRQEMKEHSSKLSPDIAVGVSFVLHNPRPLDVTIKSIPTLGVCTVDIGWTRFLGEPSHSHYHWCPSKLW